MSDLFPTFGDTGAEQVAEEMPIYTEIAWDFERNCPIVENGEFKIVTEKEAIKTWCYKTLQVNRFKHTIYSWNYGSELESLISQSFSKSLVYAECIRYVEETLLINPYILSISNVVIDFQKGKLTIDCNLNTIYGSTDVKGVKISGLRE